MQLSGVSAATGSLFKSAPTDEDGLFTNVDGELYQGSLGVRFPFMLRRLGTYFRKGDGAPELLVNDGHLLQEIDENRRSMITWVGHATVLVQMGGLNFLTDPIWSDWPSPVRFVGPRRYVKPGITIENLPPIDFVLISHNHYDHLDLPTLKALASRDPKTSFFVPLGNGGLLRSQGILKVREMDWGDSVTVEGTTVHCLPTQHWSKRGLTDTRKTLWSSWAVIGPAKRFYFAGDTGYFSGFQEIGKKLGPFDLAAMPIGAYEPKAMMRATHMNPEEAVRAVGDLHAKAALAIHFGTFDLSDEPLDEPPRRFKKEATNVGLGEKSAWVFKVGESREF